MTPSLRQRLSAAAHASLPHANPLSSQQFSALVNAVARTAPNSAVDIGCGYGPFALALAAVSRTAIVAYDVNHENLERARLIESGQRLFGSIEWVEAPFKANEEAKFDAVVCIGSSHAIGSPLEAVSRCASLAGRNGIVVLAELVWRENPDPRFLEYLGISTDFHWTTAAARDVLQAEGLAIEQRFAASPDDFHAYEDAVRLGRYAFAETLSQADRTLVLQQADEWSLMYATYGKHCLGFEAYVARSVAA